MRNAKEEGLQQRLLGGDIVVSIGYVEVQRFGNIPHRGSFETLFRDQRQSRVKKALLLGIHTPKEPNKLQFFQQWRNLHQHLLMYKS